MRISTCDRGRQCTRTCDCGRTMCFYMQLLKSNESVTYSVVLGLQYA